MPHQPPMPLITADDFGLAASVNQGVLELARAHRIDAVSVMGHRDASLGLLADLLATDVELGAHLVLVEEQPRSPRLAEFCGGTLPPSYSALFRLALMRPGLIDLLVEESTLQIEHLVGLGIPLKFINSHQHVHLFPPIWRQLRPLFSRMGLTLRAPIRLMRSPLKQFSVEVAGRLSRSLYPLHNIPFRHPLGVDSAGKLSLESARRAGAAAARLNAPCELVVHPGWEDSELLDRYPHWGYHWQTEFDLLISGSIRSQLELT